MTVPEVQKRHHDKLAAVTHSHDRSLYRGRLHGTASDLHWIHREIRQRKTKKLNWLGIESATNSAVELMGFNVNCTGFLCNEQKNNRILCFGRVGPV